MRRAAKIDANQPLIVEALSKAGCETLSLAPLGKGVPDLLIRQRSTGKWFLLEIKNLDGKGLRKNDLQSEFRARWPVSVVTSVDEALRMLR